MSADLEQAQAMAEIRARWPRRVFASLEDCGGDASVQVEHIRHDGPAQHRASLKTDPEGIHGYGSTVSGAIDDLHDMLSLWDEMLREKRQEDEGRVEREHELHMERRP